MFSNYTDVNPVIDGCGTMERVHHEKESSGWLCDGCDAGCHDVHGLHEWRIERIGKRGLAIFKRKHECTFGVGKLDGNAARWRALGRGAKWAGRSWRSTRWRGVRFHLYGGN